MKIPKKLKIGSVTLDIKLTHPDNIEGGCGDCDVINQVIRLNSDMSDDMKAFTLWHEIIHAWNTTLEEEKTDAMAQMIVTVIKDNNLYE